MSNSKGILQPIKRILFLKKSFYCKLAIDEFYYQIKIYK